MIKNILVGLAGKGNETIGKALRAASFKDLRFEKSAACQPSPEYNPNKESMDVFSDP